MKEDIQQPALYGRGDITATPLLPQSNTRKGVSEPKDSRRRMSLVLREGRCDSKTPLKIFVNCIYAFFWWKGPYLGSCFLKKNFLIVYF